MKKNLFLGWLKVYGSLDFAGGTAVHIASGVSGLVAAVILGHRHDYGRGIFLGDFDGSFFFRSDEA